MILCDTEIKAALKFNQIKIEPEIDPSRFTTSAVDLTLGHTDFKTWRTPKPGIVFQIDPSQPGFYSNVTEFLIEFERQTDGSVVMNPGDFLLALTHERVEFPIESRIAARVEGKSSLARIGLGVHLTAPTIHSGFKGHIALEIKNHGCMPIKLSPGMPICQLIFETVFGTPSAAMTGKFQDQESVKGSGNR